MEKFLIYYRENLQVKVREGLKLAAEAFYKTLWEHIKEEVILSARKSLKRIEEVMKSKEFEDRKDRIIDLIMQKIKLPLVLKPFKGLIRKAIDKKFNEIIVELIGKGLNILS